MAKVYEFWYSECIYEGGATTMSIHRTKRGAEMAMEHHKKEVYEEFERGEGCDPINMAWGVGELIIQE